MTKQSKITRLKAHGYTISYIRKAIPGKKSIIKAVKGSEVIQGSTTVVFKAVFGYA